MSKYTDLAMERRSQFTPEGKPAWNCCQAANELIRKVRENHHGMIECGDLLRVNAEKGGEKMPHCNALIRECIGYAEETLQAKGKIPSLG